MNKEVSSVLFVLLCAAFCGSVLPGRTNVESAGKRLSNETIRCQQTCEQLRISSNQNDDPVDTDNRMSSCRKKCLNEDTTTIPSDVQPTNKSAPDWCKNDRNGWKTKSEGEIIPGDAEELNVIFYRQNGEWSAKVTWSIPKGVKLTDHWGGYMLLWSSYDRVVVSCRAVDKSKTEFQIESGDGWRYPAELYIAVVGVPTIVSGHSLTSFSPVADDLDWVPQPIPRIKGDSKKKWILIGSISLCVGLLCLIAALFIWFMKSRQKNVCRIPKYSELVIANGGSTSKQLPNSPGDAV